MTSRMTFGQLMAELQDCFGFATDGGPDLIAIATQVGAIKQVRKRAGLFDALFELVAGHVHIVTRKVAAYYDSTSETTNAQIGSSYDSWERVGSLILEDTIPVAARKG